MNHTKLSASPTKKPWSTPALQFIELNTAKMPKGGVNLDGNGQEKS